ncbi:hypothetical protein PPL_04327 [Heterostelium album PN500]|uniref:Uncharacterized protein n=1 Tax=Heterostelium pallidum (strain ATCC 26659 / Pp 5 / PN500) TaxID=670386 RepID=D3B791_HETP5|nr:hypothetical protein PPL_04327 [Heterostelium album PN500]EFA82634.1 hypothetical protein PPL_04327 [Heterostelium album PN500]|eukprot:XP_020434751.1 hypothetical protein PPL_04327 [Heterostelium album PN500]
MVIAPFSGSIEILTHFVKKYHQSFINSKNRESQYTVFDTAAYMGRVDMLDYLWKWKFVLFNADGSFGKILDDCVDEMVVVGDVVDGEGLEVGDADKKILDIR